MSLKQLVAGVDLGGTTINIGLVSPQGEILEERVLCTNVQNGPDDAVIRIAEVIAGLRDNYKSSYEIVAIGIGTPGILDCDKGIILEASNLPGFGGYEITRQLTRRTGLPTSLENDANLAALGEQWLGAGDQLPDMFMITLGTGVGGALIVNNKVLKINGVSGEFGHMIIDLNGTVCNCGRKGCIETFISKIGLQRMAADRISKGKMSALAQYLPDKFSPQIMALAAQDGDELAREIFHTAGNALGIAAANVVNLVGVKRIVIGGGIANAWDHFIQPVQHAFAQTVFGYRPEKYKIVKARLGEKAGFVGAARMALSLL